MSTRAVHILDTLRGYLDNDAGFDVVKVYERQKFRDADKVRIYVNIISDDKLSRTHETGVDGSRGYATCGIFADWITAKDTSDLGTATAQYADIVDRIEKALDDLNNVLEYNPLMSSSSNFRTGLHGVEPLRVSGYVDDKAQEGRLVYEVRVFYTTGAV